MIVAFSYLFLGGIPSGLAAYLQADAKGWRFLVGFGAVFLICFGLLTYWSSSNVDRTALEHDRAVTTASMVGAMMFWAFVGAVIGKIFTGRVPSVALGVKTMIGVAVAQFVLAATGVIG